MAGYIKAAQLTILEQYETEFATIFIAWKAKQKRPDRLGEEIKLNSDRVDYSSEDK